jgi:hypothetical protein
MTVAQLHNKINLTDLKEYHSVISTATARRKEMRRSLLRFLG